MFWLELRVESRGPSNLDRKGATDRILPVPVSDFKRTSCTDLHGSIVPTFGAAIAPSDPLEPAERWLATQLSRIGVGSSFRIPA
jgi:hypothetical protein